MISKVTIQNFKRFKDSNEFVLKPDGVTFLAGGNNSGKSTFLQALAVWEFARSVMEITKGASALLAGGMGQGVGVSAEEFSPIALPDLKHLWSNLRILGGTGSDGYTLRIRSDWQIAGQPPVDRHLEFGLALANDRLFLKRTASNLLAGEAVPRLAYLPPFAGMVAREERMSPAARKRWLGRGLAGAVLRNLLYDFWLQNLSEREKLKSPAGRVSKVKLAELRKTDSWERLMMVLEEVFKTGITVSKFDELYNLTIDVVSWEGQLSNKRFLKKKGVAQKDLMVEGSGFLQWLSVYALAVNPELDVLLLDEPDAHLHPALQGHLIQKLRQLARENNKQVLLATHSTTILSETAVNRIFRMEDRSYLTDETGRVSLFIGLGSQYAPRLDQLKRTRRLFLHDGPSNTDILQAWAETLRIRWPQLTDWIYKRNAEIRKALVAELRKDIPDLKALSLEDRDNYPLTETKADLTYGSMAPFSSGLGLRMWRRRNIENYLLSPSAIARAAGTTEQAVSDFLRDVHGLNITLDFSRTDCPQALANADGKEIFLKNARSVSKEFGVTQKQVAEAMTISEIPDDPKEFLRQLVELCK